MYIFTPMKCYNKFVKVNSYINPHIAMAEWVCAPTRSHQRQSLNKYNCASLLGTQAY